MRVTAGVFVLALVSACTSSTTETTASTLPPTPPSSVVTQQLLAELDLEGLARSVARLRELEFLQPVAVQIVEDDTYQTRVGELTAPPPGFDSDLQSSWLKLLGVLPPEGNVDSATSRFLQATVAIYDHEANRILVRESAGVDPYVESVVVHELVHALQQQHFGVADTRLLDGDLGYVYTALVEGDAERVSRRFIGELSQADEFAYEAGRLDALEDSIVVRSSTPHFAIDSLTQPTDDGVRFLQGLDYPTVNSFLADLDGLTSLPPSSEAMILPDAPLGIADLELPPPPVAGYQPVSAEGTLGVGRLRLLVGLGLDDQIVNQAVAGWNGDRLEIWAAGDDVIFAYLFAGDRAEDAEELAAAFGSLLDTNLPADAYGSVRVADTEVLVVAASDPSIEAQLDELYGNIGEEVFLVQPTG